METRNIYLRGVKQLRPFFKVLLCAAALLVFGPASAQINFPGAANSPEAAPDLVITDIWNSGPLICYQVYNRGDAGTGDPFIDVLKVDNVTVGSDLVAILLGPGERYSNCFKYSWTCTGTEDTILVAADFYDDVKESNESNNTRSETWKCDQTAPKITSGPTVSDITTNSAKISWTTDEPSNSEVLYDRRTNTFGGSKIDLQPVKAHQINLTMLMPGTLYQFKVVSADTSGNQVESDPAFFKTKPTTDTQKPQMSGYRAERMPGDTQFFRISIDADDNDKIDRVEFYLDKQLIGIDYSPDADVTSRFTWDIFPGVLGMDMPEFDGDHLLQIQAFDRFGNSTFFDAPVFHPFVEPLNGALEFLDLPPIYDYYIPGSTAPANTIIHLDLHASQYYQDCLLERLRGPNGEIYGCREREKAVDYVEIYIDGHLTFTDYPANDDDLFYEFDWDISGMSTGSHTIHACSHAGGLSKCVSHIVKILHGAAKLDIERTVALDGHQLRVLLRIRNNGTVAAHLYNVTDNLDGFQPIHKSSTYYTVTSAYVPGMKRNIVNIDLHSEASDYKTLDPGWSFNVTYNVAPVLYRTVDRPRYLIGDDPVRLDYRQETHRKIDNFDLETRVISDGPSLEIAITDIQEYSDYLIVTNPCNLFRVNASRVEVDQLLSGLAELADAKHGILAYLVGNPNANIVDDAIETWGAFMKGSDGVTRRFLSNGYVLLVGETDIIPAHIAILEAPWYVDRGDMRVDPTDMVYADTDDYVIDPELNLGRIPGDTAARLLKPVETILGVTRRSAGYSFDWSDALIVSGWPESRGGGSSRINFAEERNGVANLLSRHVAHTTTMSTTSYGTREAARDAFFSNAINKDIIHIAGHGNPFALDDIRDWDFDLFTNPFHDANPFVYASSCLTGDYTRGRGLAERFLENGAGLYLGSTEISYCCTNTSVANRFYSAWTPGDAVGPVLKRVKRDIGGFDFWNWYAGFYENIWTAEYHLLGDPEYGYGAYALKPELAIPTLSIEGPEAVHAITIPDYVLSKTDLGKDMAEIPGGFFVMMPGKPLVPSYSITGMVPAGMSIQDVIMSERSGLKTASGIDLVVFEPAEAGQDALPELPAEMAERFPTVDFDWGVNTLPDGSSELHIVIYPFFYNTLTQAVDFYTTYQFIIPFAYSSVTISMLDTDAPVYDPGDTVLVDMAISASGNPQTAIVSAAVYALGSYELVDGLLIDNLSQLSGTATYAMSWDSTKADFGDYFVVAELHDLQGQLLHTQTTSFRLGMVSGEASNLSAPNYFKIGDKVPLDFWFENTGTLPITGTAVIRVEGVSSGDLSELQTPISNLLPLASAHISVNWNSAGKPEDDYQVIAYVVFEGQTTPALTKVMQTTHKLRLPLVRKK